ncbi:hypothetical protein ACFQFH_09800 [Halobaculum halobium]|uniref:Uncharacterized protein n=1 Tax=Halobaculum halobium TaxID=3032281 RepID=A0ABD5TFE9_9EURY|nr:hypothetical protein [Halobaculum sp. SYNS20]
MTVAEETRAAVRERPFLYDALRAGVVNYAAAAATLDIDADRDAVATALRRFADELDGEVGDDADARVRLERGVGAVEGDTDAPEPLLAAGGTAYAGGAGNSTAVVAAGDAGPRALERVLGRLRTAGVAVEAAGVTPTGLVVVVGRRAGADALRAVEAALDG